MKLRISGLLVIAGCALAGILGSAQSLAQSAYITNSGGGIGNTVSVIDTASNTVTATITRRPLPYRCGGHPGR